MNSKENSNKQVIVIRKTMQDVKEEFNEDRNPEKNEIEILEMKSAKSNKIISRLDQIEDRISGLEHKTDVLEHSDKYKEKKYKWNTYDSEAPLKDQIY
jgi:predicted nuclease with TOPRIM domain